MALAQKKIFPKASTQKAHTKADIIFCIDVTGSMQPCIDALKANMVNFVNALHSAANVDYRLKLVAYRDIHDTQVLDDGTRACDQPWFITPFMNDPNEFSKCLNHDDVQAFGGGDDPESTLDALYIAITTKDWRPSGTHRSIVLFTDDDSHPKLHTKTYNRPGPAGDVGRVNQAFQTMPHAMLFMVVPRFRIYEQLEQAMVDADRKIIAKYVPYHNGDPNSPYYGLSNVDWNAFLKMLGETVSKTSITVQDRV